MLHHSRVVIICALLGVAASKTTIGNHAISSSFCNISDVIINPPEYGVYLTLATDTAPSALTLTLDGAAPVPFDALFGGAPGDRIFPACRLVATAGALTVTYNAFAPLSPSSSVQGFLPFLVLQFDVHNTDGASAHSFGANFAAVCGGGFCTASSRTGLIVAVDGSHLYSFNGSLWVGAAGGPNSTTACATPLCAGANALVPPGGTARVSLFVGHYAAAGRYAAAYPSLNDLFSMAVTEEDALAASHASFVAALPSVGDAVVDAAQRWFLTAPVLLTKGVHNQSITMGTTWVHVMFFWPDLDAEMLRECAANQQPDGKIPTTVLPIILRDDNIDVTAYYVARVARNFQVTGDLALLQALYPSVQRALRYLQSRDTMGVGVPSAIISSPWADWMDVDYMTGRRYAPHFDLLYLVALRVGAEMATLVGNDTDATDWTARYASGYAWVNAPQVYSFNATSRHWDVSGLWNGHTYAMTFYDGRTVNWTMSDTAVGVFFGVVSADRAATIWAWEAANGNDGKFGIRNLYPYIPNATQPAFYGNGGTYPWLSCLSAVNRLRGSAPAAGARIWNATTWTQLWGPQNAATVETVFEYVDSEKGVSDGQSPQGWDGSCFLRSALGDLSWGRASPVELVPSRGPPADAGAWAARGPPPPPAAPASAALDVFHVRVPRRDASTAAGAGCSAPAAAGARDINTLLPLTRHGAFLRVAGRAGALRLRVVADAAPPPARRVAATAAGAFAWTSDVACAATGADDGRDGPTTFRCPLPRGGSVLVVATPAAPCE